MLLIDLAFFLLIAITVAGSVWLSGKFKERHAEFPWWKAVMLIAGEVAAWVIVHEVLTAIPRWLAPIIVVVVVVILLRKKK